jgi:hypothetical protein
MLQNYRRAYPPQKMLPATLQVLETGIAGSDGPGRRYLLAKKKKVPLVFSGGQGRRYLLAEKKKDRWVLAAGKAAGNGSGF